MRCILTILATICLLSASAQAQTVKAISFNTTTGVVVANTGTNKLTFNDDVRFAQGDFVIASSGAVLWQGGLAFEIENKTFYGPWNFNQPAEVRTNLGLPLAALTNTSNVTAMRALAGSTNTNEPYSGTISLTNTNTLTFSNGVLLKIQ